VIQKILHVARNFSIIRFDAAMVLAKKHIRRLWYPEPGHGGDIASRAEYAISEQEFEKRIPEEFWREVVDRAALEAPDTLLLAEAFWMLEGYFVRTLGMHRVYNSAFMNMLKKEENQKYRETIKNTLEFDPQVLKRFVNFMNNPDEETAEAQFGTGDKYFGICTMMVTMPGLPMFGHGQLEGFTEKYGMEYTRDYKNETPDSGLVARHEREIFPLMKKRYLFAEIQNFLLFDVRENGVVNENVFAYANRRGEECAVVFFNNVYQTASGWIKESFANAVRQVNTDAPAESGVSRESHSIAYAMGLSKNENEYCIFREFKSDLWYIRKSSDIQNDGLFVRLNGFEVQILMDVSCVHDDETKKYALLCNTLGGRGVKNIEEALEDIFLKDILSAFENVFSWERLEDLKSLTQKSKQKTVTQQKVFDDLKPDAMEFFASLEKFITGNYGARKVFDVKKRGKLFSSENMFKRLRLRLKRLLKLWTVISDIDRVKKTPVSLIKHKKMRAAQTVYVSRTVPATFAEAVSAFNEAMPLFEMLALWCVLYSLRDAAGSRCSAAQAKNLAALWALDRRLAKILSRRATKASTAYNEARFPAEDSLRFYTKSALEAMPLCVSSFAAKKPSKAAANTKVAAQKLSSRQKTFARKAAIKKFLPAAHKIAIHFFRSKNAPYICGVNMYNNVLWFNKENFETATLFALLLHDLFAPKNSLEETDAVYTLLAQAKDASEYQAEKLLALLTKK
jgi:hypothetical protein